MPIEPTAAYFEDEHGEQIALGDDELDVFHHVHIAHVQRENHGLIDRLLEEHAILTEPFYCFPSVEVLVL